MTEPLPRSRTNLGIALVVSVGPKVPKPKGLDRLTRMHHLVGGRRSKAENLSSRQLLQSCWPGPPRSATPTIASSPNATSRGPADASSARSRPTRPVCPANHTCTSEKYARSTRHQSKIVGETSSDRKALSRLLPRILCTLLWMWKHE